MKNLFLILPIVLLSTLSPACKNQEKTMTKSNTTMKQDNTYALVVSFISIGQGVDSKAIEQFNNFIAAFEKEHAITVNYEKIPWGREGEVDYCFALSHLKKDLKTQFIKEIENLLSNNDLVKVEKNAPCVHKR